LCGKQEQWPGTSASAIRRLLPALEARSFRNQAIIIGANPSPSALVGNSREQIASILADPTNPLAQGLIAAANYISSAICHMDGQAPASVCTSPGVKAANVKMGYKS